LIRVLIATLVLVFVRDERTPVPGFFDLPVTGGTATYEMLALQPEERGHAIALLAREMFTQSASAIQRSESVRHFIAQISAPGRAKEIAADTQPITIAAPLTADHWRDVLQLPNNGDLFGALLSNRSALLVCAGAMATDPSMRALLERDRGLLRWIVKTAPAAFWIAARHLKVDEDRIVVPGGAAAEPLWEALVAVKVTRPADFLRAMLARDSGRLAWFYDSIGTMSAERAAAAFGAPPVQVQIEQVRAFYDAFRSADSNWNLEEHPFLRGSTDPWIVASQTKVEGSAVASPAAQWFWEALFGRTELERRSAASIRREPATPVTLGWLAQQVSSVSAKERRDRFEMVRFAQAVFGNIDGDRAVEALVALGGYRRYRVILLSLDRMEVANPRVYARLIEAVRKLDGELSGRDEKHAVIAFQTAVAILERARLTHEIDVARTETLLLSLADAVDPQSDHKTRLFTTITQWMLTTLLDGLPALVQPDQWTGAKTAYESRFLQALAGPPSDPNAPALKWEGLDYRVDLFAAEQQRLNRIREQIDSPGLDAALTADDAEKISAALLSMIYTPALGDPEGAALLGGDIAQRHNFGLVGPAGMRRGSMAWSMPREQVGDGSPWHIEGSILGLDIALARLSLRRIADNEMPIAPTINLNDQLTFARTVMTLNPRELGDGDRDRLVAAIERGRRRVAQAGANLSAVMALAVEAQLSHSVRQTLAWTITRTPEAVPSLFRLRDQMWLGKPDLPQRTLDRWGIYAERLDNRWRTAMPAAAPWENFGGRADGGLVATQAPDLVLRMAQETARLKLPAQLVPGLLTYAAQDYWHDVDSRFPDDWPAITRQALALSSTRVEDYVAALAGGGPLRPK
jgi:hypothetical protein